MKLTVARKVLYALLAACLALLTMAAPGLARGHSYHRSYSPRSYYRSYSPRSYHRSYRFHSYRRSRIHRSEEARREFERMTGYPHGRPGYIVDHVVPLACGGADDPSNMQWQTVSAAKAKDKWERKGCSLRR